MKIACGIASGFSDSPGLINSQRAAFLRCRGGSLQLSGPVSTCAELVPRQSVGRSKTFPQRCIQRCAKVNSLSLQGKLTFGELLPTLWRGSGVSGLEFVIPRICVCAFVAKYCRYSLSGRVLGLGGCLVEKRKAFSPKSLRSLSCLNSAPFGIELSVLSNGGGTIQGWVQVADT